MKIDNISVNTLLKSSDSEHVYRILWLSDDRLYAYLFDITAMVMPELCELSDIAYKIQDGSLVAQDNDPYVKAVAEDRLNDKERAIRDNIWNVVSGALTMEPDIYVRQNRGEIIANLVKETGKHRKNLYVYLKTYWKHGKAKNAFLPSYKNCGAPDKERCAGEQKRGRPRKYSDSVGVNVGDEMKAIFESAIKKYYHTRKEDTFRYAYEMMIRDRFTRFEVQPDGKTKAELLPEDEIPTIGQFRYWYNKKHDIAEKLRKRKGDTKFELNHRAVTGKSDFGIMGPGAKYQIDATIGDIYLVSRFNRADIIGRPVIYFVIDVYSRMIAGMYVGLEGPSWAGSMMAIANACSDKVKYCAEYGIAIAHEEWPCNGVPSAILGDRGEMESKSAETLINALNVRVENAKAYRGDMKGIIEQNFNRINESALRHLPGHVRSDANDRGATDYRLAAKLDIYQLTKVLIQCVLYHNNQHLHETFERTAEMIADDVPQIPLQVWNWGITHCSGALRSFPENIIKLALMPSDTASVTAKGIRFKGLYYLCRRATTEFWFETARAKGSFKIDISYDPRNMSRIYIRDPDGSTEQCWLAEWQEKYTDKCLDEIIKLRESEKAAQQKYQTQELASKADLSAAIGNIIAEAEDMARETPVPKSMSERTKNIRENRRAEKEANRIDEVFTLEENEISEVVEQHLKSTADADIISSDLSMIMQQLEERLNEK